MTRIDVEFVKLATSECFRLSDLVVNTEHLLLALLRMSPAERLELAGIDRSGLILRVEQNLAAERARMGDAVLIGERGTPTPRFRRALDRGNERADRESREAGIRDFWHGLLNDTDGRAVPLLAECGFDADVLRKVLA